MKMAARDWLYMVGGFIGVGLISWLLAWVCSKFGGETAIIVGAALMVAWAFGDYVGSRSQIMWWGK